MPQVRDYAVDWYDAYDAYDPRRDGPYDADGRLRFTAAMRQLDAWLTDQPPATVVQVGAGTGTFSLSFARTHPQHQFLATDINPTAVAFMNRRIREQQIGNATAAVMDMRALRLPPETRAVFGQAVCVFLTPAELRAFLTTTADRHPDAVIALSENAVVKRPRWFGQPPHWAIGTATTLPNNRGAAGSPAWSHNWFTCGAAVPGRAITHVIEHYSTPDRLIRAGGQTKMAVTLCHSLTVSPRPQPSGVRDATPHRYTQ